MTQNSKTKVLAGQTYASDTRRRTKAHKHSVNPARFQQNRWDVSATASGALWYYLMARRVF